MIFEQALAGHTKPSKYFRTLVPITIKEQQPIYHCLTSSFLMFTEPLINYLLQWRNLATGYSNQLRHHTILRIFFIILCFVVLHDVDRVPCGSDDFLSYSFLCCKVERVIAYYCCEVWSIRKESIGKTVDVGLLFSLWGTQYRKDKL